MYATTVRILSVEPLLEDFGRIILEGIHWVIASAAAGRLAGGVSPLWDAPGIEAVECSYRKRNHYDASIPLSITIIAIEHLF